MLSVWWIAAAAAVGLATGANAALDLRDNELRWLEAAMPVLAYARAQSLPLDIIVQPQVAPGETPVGMAYMNGRCKLVLSMRGNPEAATMLDGVPPGLHGPVIEAMAAHELAHCWRHRQQSWGSLPAGLHDITGFSRVSAEQAGLLQDMWRTRREEGFADLVGLAWTLQRHPAQYAEIHAWLLRQRSTTSVDTGPHDTRAWVQLAEDRALFQPASSLFEQVQLLWITGLLAGS